MALRKRRNMAVGSPSGVPAQHSSVGGDGWAGSSLMKFVLLAWAVVVVLLVFAVSWKREEKGSCRLCLGGDGLVREWRDGDGGRLLELGFAEEGDGEVVGRIMSHQQICPRLFHEKQISRLDLMHALNNLMQVPLLSQPLAFVIDLCVAVLQVKSLVDQYPNFSSGWWHVLVHERREQCSP